MYFWFTRKKYVFQTKKHTLEIMPRTTGSNIMKVKGSLVNITAKKVSSNLSPWSKLGRLVLISMKEREKRGHPLPLRLAAAMAGLHCSPKSSDFPDFDHQTSHNRHQSKVELNTNTSMRLRTSMTDRGWSAAQDGGGAIAGCHTRFSNEQNQVNHMCAQEVHTYVRMKKYQKQCYYIRYT
jgi:hypothetical protein